jgi:cation:H+ antiporter
MKSASYAITAISDYAKQTGISEYLIGFLVVSIGTSLPELCTAVFSSLANNGAISLGDAIGANVIDVTIVMGLTAIFGRKILVKDKLGKTFYVIMGLVILPLILGLDGQLSRYDGVIMVLAFGIYILSLIKKEKKIGKMQTDIKLKDIWKDIFVFGGAIAALLLAARWFVLSAATMAYMLEIPNFLMGVIFVAVATTIPELTVEIKSILHKHSGIAFGDIMGSVAANISLVIGVAALINPIYFEKLRFISSSVFMIVTVFIALMLLRKKRITWKHGIFVVALYILFIILQAFLQ